MADNLAFQEDIWEELINGEIVQMSPSPITNHNRIIGNIISIFNLFLRGRQCEAFTDGLTVFLDEKNHYIPDMMVVCDPNKVQYDGIHGAPDLVVEVLSPSTAKNDKIHKKAVYERYGVREYWLVNPTDKSIEQYFLTDGQFILHDVYQIHPDILLQKMSEAEKAAIVTEFKCSLYDDLIISLNDVFDRVN